MSRNNFNNYPPHFQEYMIKSFWPAMAFAETKEGKQFISDHSNLGEKILMIGCSLFMVLKLMKH